MDEGKPHTLNIHTVLVAIKEEKQNSKNWEAEKAKKITKKRSLCEKETVKKSCIPGLHA